jgi:hypothetical protein
MWSQRIKETVAMLMIGDGLLALAEPERHCQLWMAGPRFWQKAVEPFVEHPPLARTMGALELVAGFWLASRQYVKQPRHSTQRAGTSLRTSAHELMNAVR